MAGIEDLVTLYRGEAPSRSWMNFGSNRGTYYTGQKDFARHIAQGGSLSQNKLVKDMFGKVKSLKVPKKLFEELGGSNFEVNIRDPKLLKAAKTDLFQTFLARVGSLSPLAMKGLNILASLPVATATMVLQSTPANADEANMTLEDFAMMANQEKEGIETIDIGDME
tara:strand:- start:43 stop:543 length:501 start_codon:yes stop_codon:yes gene_type:complete